MNMIVTHPNGAQFHAPPQWQHFDTFIKWGWSVSAERGVCLTDLLDAAREVAE